MNLPHLPRLLALLLAAAFLSPSTMQAEPKPDVVQPQKKEDVPPELRTPRVDRRTEKLRKLIVQGINESTLTQGEATSLQHELARIERREESFKHNARVTQRERAALNRDLNDLHERIWKKTHNGTKPEEPLVK